jgi:hypothetical protein
LIYNSQTVTPITTNLQNAAEAENIPVVPVSETMPPNVNYQTWMLDEMNAFGTGARASDRTLIMENSKRNRHLTGRTSRSNSADGSFSTTSVLK